MPYTKEHKQQTKNKILRSAKSLFSTKGYDAVTIHDVMNNCSLTRGAFYAHFKSKAELYREALKFSAISSELAKEKPKDISAKEWLSQMLDTYLSIEHVRGEKPCPLAFLANDVVSRDKKTKRTYTDAYKSMNRIMSEYAGTDLICSEKDMHSLTSMIIGAVAIARSLEDQSLIMDILSTCRQQARSMLGGI